MILHVKHVALEPMNPFSSKNGRFSALVALRRSGSTSCAAVQLRLATHMTAADAPPQNTKKKPMTNAPLSVTVAAARPPTTTKAKRTVRTRFTAGSIKVVGSSGEQLIAFP